jgi:acyl-CoA synthetase (AMP-forming)/AMP-acid ligase II
MAENVFAVTQSEPGSAPNVDVVDPAALSRNENAQALRTLAGGTQMLSNGRALPNVQIEIRSADGATLPERHLGEIALRSDCLLESYYKRPDLTSGAFSGGWYLTGDLGYLADAELYITGRKKDVMIVGGKNIHPHDIEDLAGAVAGVHAGRVVAFGVFNAERGTEDVVLVAEADTPATAELAAAVRDRVNRGTDVALAAVHLVPPGWIIKTSSGKAARSANRDKYQAAVAGTELR